MRPARVHDGLRPLRRPGVGGVLGVALLVAASAVRLGGPRWVLEPGYSDHMRHEYAAWALLHIGPRVLTTPISQWHVHAAHPHAQFWTFLPDYYPPGRFAFFLPFGVLSNERVLSDSHTHLLMIMCLAAVAVVAAAMLVRMLRLVYDPSLALVLGAIGAFTFVYWSLNGFIDPLAAGLALTGLYLAERGSPGPALLALTAGLSVHFRLWFLWPAVLALVAREWRRIPRWQLAVSGVVGVLSLVAFVLAAPSIRRLGQTPGKDTNYLALQNGLTGERAIALAGGVLLVAIVYLAERRLAPAACVALALCLVFGVNQWEAWYPILLFPLFGLLRSRVAQGALTLAFVQLTVVLTGSPAFTRDLHLYYDAIRH